MTLQPLLFLIAFNQPCRGKAFTAVFWALQNKKTLTSIPVCRIIPKKISYPPHTGNEKYPLPFSTHPTVSISILPGHLGLKLPPPFGHP